MQDPQEILKECPSCDTLQDHLESNTEIWAHDDKRTFIQCCECGMTGPHATSLAEAIFLWNKLPRNRRM